MALIATKAALQFCLFCFHFFLIDPMLSQIDKRL